MGNSLIHGMKHLKIQFKNPFLKMLENTRALDLDGIPWEHLATAHPVNKEGIFMKKIFFLVLATSISLFIACSDNSTSSEIKERFHYDTSLSYDETTLSIDSISNCLNDSARIEQIYKFDSIYIEQKTEKETIAFPSQIHSSRSNIKSIGIHTFGDTLKIELIEKEKTPDIDLCCLVWIQATLNGTLKGNYIKTFTGVYPLGNR